MIIGLLTLDKISANKLGSLSTQLSFTGTVLAIPFYKKKGKYVNQYHWITDYQLLLVFSQG